MRKIKKNGPPCRHDYKNAIHVSDTKRVCPLCNNHIDPNEWFLITYFESLGVKFIDTSSKMIEVNQKSHHYD